MNRPGDWNCRSCQHLNFQRRDSCQRCGDPRPGDYGGGGRMGSAFGFTGPDVRPGDWYCAVGNCGAHNFASRSSCFKCGAVKDDVGGGGFDSEFSRGRGFGFGGGSGGGGGGGGAGRGGNPVTGFAPDRDAMSTTSQAGWSASGAMHQGNSAPNLHFNTSF